ncbi:phosphodiester glycosidase family protein [Streptococcus ovuberis]|uniref:Phosphodiester glycosidase family protein n=1 Tax=Streptococcus ovuberis TaxID=1936207 RepID=A0A7X6MZD7_9STRE|nr:phosphodiester glycosidase family protein [Streptococcus ovuberis]NKZ20588.1 phosphodiester glycosidase family protein [Streptococcus ovuberis]
MRKVKKHAYAILFSIVLLMANAYALLKTFVLATAVATVVETPSVQTTQLSTVETTSSTSSAINTGQITSTDTSYQDDNMSVTIETFRQNDTTAYVADVTISDPSLLKTALAQDTYGTNITATTSSIAASKNAIFAVNGDYYGANQTGYVIKNGVLYRDTARSTDYEDLVQYTDGTLGVISEAETTAQALLDSGVVNTFTFGPTLIEDGEITVSTSDEVGRAMADNPRTAIGIIEEEDGSLHYIFVVSDGRSEESTGLSLYELAEIMQSYDVDLAYNLDGGGSSTMYFNGQVINKPTTNGSTIKERAVSDIVYIGYN